MVVTNICDSPRLFNEERVFLFFGPEDVMVTEEIKSLRQRAEDAESRQAAPDSGTTPAPERLLHELRVNLIELEMQNEELLRIQDELEAERARYLEFYDFAPVGYLTLCLSGTIEALNITAADLLGAARATLVGQPIFRFIHHEDQDIYHRFDGKLRDNGEPQACELRMVKPGGAPLWVRMETKVLPEIGAAPLTRVVLRDITRYKLKEDEREQLVRLIHSINSQADLRQCMSALTSSLQSWSDCEAVGIRLRLGADYPYYETRGFPAEFVAAENYLCTQGSDGAPLVDSAGNQVLECMCGNVLSGRFDPSQPCFSANGSFWSNTTSSFEAPPGARNRCFSAGYESVALVPLRTGAQVFGLLQFNDPRPGRFTPSLIAHFEKMAVDLALSLSRRQAEEALIRNKNALKKSRRLLAETERIGKVGGWEIDVDTRKQTWTDEIYHILEIELPYDPTLDNGLDFYTPASRPVIERAVQRTIEHGEPFDEELEVTTAQGNFRSVHVIGNADLECRRVYGFLQDITERKRAEAYREMAREVLKIVNRPGSLKELIPLVLTALKSRTRFDAVAIRLQDGDDFPYFCQEGFSEEFLRTEGTLVKRLVDGGLCRDKRGEVCLECTCGMVISGKADPAEAVLTAGGSFYTNDSAPFLELPPELDARLNPRNVCIHQGYASVALVPIHDGGRIVGLIQFNDRRKECFTLATIERLEEIAGFIGGVLMRKRFEEEKLALQRQYQETQKLESLGVLAGGIAHDFNNLLMIIMGHCSLAKLDPDIVACSLSEIEKASERAAGLCSQMLAYAGKSQSMPGDVDLKALLDEMVKMLKSGIKQNAPIRLELPSAAAVIRGDASQLRQIVMNLIINASEAIGAGQGEIGASLARVEIGAGQKVQDHLGKTVPPGWYCRLEVSDTGCGMADETLRRIFEPFYTTKFAGRGLGLSATLGIITSHGGALQVSSQLGRGTTFTVYFPLYCSASAAAVALPAATAPWRGSGTVLLAEDEDQVRLIARTLLESLGFQVVEASNGSEALEIYRRTKEKITLVLTDMGMPVMDGQQLFRELKKIDQELPVIISSGFGDDNITSLIPREEIAGLLSKPYTFDQLRGVLKSVVRKPDRDC